MPPSFTRGIFTLPLEIDGHHSLREAKGWLSEESRTFLRRLMAVKPFAQRLERAIELKEELDSRDRSSPEEERSPRASLPGTSESFSISRSRQTRVRPGWLAQPERKGYPR